MGWLLLTRKNGQSIKVGDDMTIIVKEVKKEEVRLKVYEGNKQHTFTLAPGNTLPITDEIQISVRDLRSTEASIGVNAPRHISVDRKEIWAKKQAEKKAG